MIKWNWLQAIHMSRDLNKSSHTYVQNLEKNIAKLMIKLII